VRRHARFPVFPWNFPGPAGRIGKHGAFHRNLARAICDGRYIPVIFPGKRRGGRFARDSPLRQHMRFQNGNTVVSAASHQDCLSPSTYGDQMACVAQRVTGLIDPRLSLAPQFRSRASVQPRARQPVSPRPANLLLSTAEWGREKQISSRGHTSPGSTTVSS
jgi:hypothetical protein